MAQHLGQAFSILARQEAEEITAHADIALFGGDGACHVLVARKAEARQARAWRKATLVSGMSPAAFDAAWKALPRRACERLLGDVLERMGGPGAWGC